MPQAFILLRDVLIVHLLCAPGKEYYQTGKIHVNDTYYPRGMTRILWLRTDCPAPCHGFQNYPIQAPALWEAVQNRDHHPPTRIPEAQ